MDFKFFNALLENPAFIFTLSFLFVIVIIILFKVDAVEKKVEELIKEVKKLNERLDKIEEGASDLGEDMDIIDKFLHNKGYEIVDKKTKNKSNMETILQDSKVSYLLDPRKED